MPKLALVHDWLTGMRGGEKALEVICERFPKAEIFTLLHVPGSVSATIENRPIHTSFVQRLPMARRRYRNYLPLFPSAVEGFRLEGFDLVLSVSHCVAKSAIKAPGAFHLCYCLTPMRYAWDQFDAYFGPRRVGRAGSTIMRPIMDRIARWDAATSSRPDRYLAISHYVAGRIGRYYNRAATVVYPPVDTNFFQPDRTTPERFALVVSALVPYKRIDLAIDACLRAKVPLKIVGDGPERAVLQRKATDEVRFLGRLPDAQVRDMYRRCAVVLLPGEEDFGIVPLEAQACGRPVVALARGGAVETVVHGETGFLVNEEDPDAFANAIDHAVRHRLDALAIRRHAEGFGRERFGDEIERFVNEAAPEGESLRSSPRDGEGATGVGVGPHVTKR